MAVVVMVFAMAGRSEAHPHVFIDAGVAIVTDGAGQVEAVEVTWRYDPFYTLLVVQDHGLDGDRDWHLSEAEVRATLGFDLNWNSGFDGGLRVRRGDVDLALGAPVPVALRLLESGQLESVHRRPVLDDPGGTDPLTAQIYDPAFYIAFDVVLPSRIEGTDCAPARVPADLDAANRVLDAALRAAGGFEAAEDDFPAVGALFADTLVFRCAE